MNKPRVIVVSGPSGVGKSTICHRLCTMLPAEWSVSVTTRQPRRGERDGVDYHFISMIEYERLVESGGLLEHAIVHGNGYGTPADPVLRAIAAGKNVVMEIDVRGAQQVCQRMPEAMFFFIIPPSFDELARRLRGRQTEQEAVILERLERSQHEMSAAKDCGVYHHFVMNDDQATTENKILELIRQGE